MTTCRSGSHATGAPTFARGARLLFMLGMIAGAGACEGPTEPARAPAELVAMTAVEQSAMVGTAVVEPPAVRALDAQGRPLARVAIGFTLVDGGGALGATSALTDADGVARLDSWTLGTSTGVNQLRAVAANGGPAVIFSARGEPAAPARLGVLVQPATLIPAGAPLTTPPIIEIRDAYGNPVQVSNVAVTATPLDGSVPLAGMLTVAAFGGRATFGNLVPGASGTAGLRFSSPGLEPVTAEPFVVPTIRLCGGPVLGLDLALGGHRRFRATDPGVPSCLRFDPAVNAGQEYLVIFENLPVNGAFGSSLFFAGFDDPSHMTAVVRAGPIEPVTTAGARPAPADAGHGVGVAPHDALPAGTRHAWDFGDGVIYEGEIDQPVGGVPPARLVRRGGTIDINTPGVFAAVGDTIVVRMQGIPRLNISTGDQRAIVRHISQHLIIAEDVRLGTLLRGNERLNTPIPAGAMDTIAAEFNAYGARMLDALFLGRHNNAVESQNPRRSVAVHSLTTADNIWGYTYSSTDYFVFDYWVGSDGVNRTLAQHPQRIADNLFTHEISHMRHWGLNERAGRNTGVLRGNRWLVEGFALFVERLPVAARLLGQELPIRTGNVVLPVNPAFGGSWYRGDVPDYSPGSFFQGYEHSGWFFDYLADHVALAGGDWLAAIRDVVVHAGVESDLDAAVGRALPGLAFGDALTRARHALYLDDIGTAGLPAWTQFQQYRLRASRGSQTDPRSLWPRYPVGTSFARTIPIPSGSSWGMVIDGRTAGAASLIELLPTVAPNAVFSVTRIR